MPKGIYERTRRPIIDRFGEKYMPEPMSGCWLWVGYTLDSGYGKIGLGGRYGNDLAHRVSWRLHNGEIPDGLFVCHKCDTPSCVNPDHLFLGTPKQNTADACEKGRMRGPNKPARGERVFLSRLSADDVRKIRGSTESQASLARRFNVSKATVSAICRFETWRHVA